MTDVLSWTITAIIVVLVVLFLLSIISMRTLPTDERPATATYNRFGEFMGMEENPDYHENPGELEEEAG